MLHDAQMREKNFMCHLYPWSIINEQEEFTLDDRLFPEKLALSIRPNDDMVSHKLLMCLRFESQALTRQSLLKSVTKIFFRFKYNRCFGFCLNTILNLAESGKDQYPCGLT